MYVIPILSESDGCTKEEMEMEVLLIAQQLRKHKIPVESYWMFQGNFKTQLRRVPTETKVVVLVGKKELSDGEVTVKNWGTGEQHVIKRDSLHDFILKIIK